MFKNIQKIINFIYPPKCILCDDKLQSVGLCASCFNDLEIVTNSCPQCGFVLPNNSQICLACNQKKRYFDGVIYRHLYNDSIYKIIYKFKEQDDLYLADFLAQVFQQSLQQYLMQRQIKFDIIIPVPMHYFKIIKRKYSHMAILAKKLSKLMGINYNLFALKKIKNTKEQKLLSSQLRAINLNSAFEVNSAYAKIIENKVVLLIDDIITTGATIQQCSKALKNAGAKEVYALSLARVSGILKI